MKTSTKLGVAAIVVAIAYPVSSWYSGKCIEDTVNTQLDKTEQMSMGIIKIVDRKFERSAFSSVSSATLVLSLPEMDEIKLAWRSRFKHGPFAGGTIAAASSEDELVLESSSQIISTLLDGKSQFESRSTYYFGGSVRNVITSPAFTVDIAKITGEEKGPQRISWSEFHIDGTYSADFSKYSYKGKIPSLVIEDDKLKITLNNIELEEDKTRVFDNEDFFRKGTQKFLVGEVNTEPPIAQMREFAYTTLVAVKDDFADLSFHIGAESAKIDEKEIGPASYDMSFKHLHARTVADIFRGVVDMVDIYPNLLSAQRNDYAAMAGIGVSVMATFMPPMIEIMKNSPEVNVNQLRFNTPQGEVQLAASATITDFKPSDFSNLATLTSKINANGNSSIPIAFFEKEPNAAKIKSLIEQGYATEENGFIKINMVFKNGQFTLNGKPYDPSSMLDLDDTSEMEDEEGEEGEEGEGSKN